MKLTFENNRFIAQVAFDERSAPKNAGFWWDSELKSWVTSEIRIALALRDVADEKAKKILDKSLITITPFSGPILFSPGLSPYPYQLDAVRFALSRNRSLLGLCPGLGKSAIAAMIAATTGQHVLFICPPFLKLTIEREFKTWCPRSNAVTVLPDTMLDKALGERLLSTKSKDTILIVDECHRFKSGKAQRSRALFHKFVPKFDRVIFMSGTPMPNRPFELYPILHFAAPELIDFADSHAFALKYCNAFQDEWGRWNYNGASNSEELFSKMREKFMLRIKKSDVLTELPPKVEELLILDAKEPAKCELMSQKIIKEFQSQDISAVMGSDKIATYRRELGDHKAPIVAKVVKEYLENSDESILLFAHHKSVVANLYHLLADFEPLLITGDVPTKDRNAIVDTFQKNPAHRLLIGNIDACGVGFTMTKATRVIFAESSWTPAANSQAADRAHRLGQLDTVFVQHCVIPNTLDANILMSVLKKQNVINKL